MIDKRERDILKVMEQLPEFADSFGNQIKWRAEHLTTGDFIIFRDKKALMVIERKTWIDFAASIRDNRKKNIEKLIKYRSATGAKIAYLIEGHAFPANTARFSRIPYVNIRAHLDHLVYRDDVIEIRTPSLFGTAERLFQLVKNISSIVKVGGHDTEPADVKTAAGLTIGPDVVLDVKTGDKHDVKTADAEPDGKTAVEPDGKIADVKTADAELNDLQAAKINHKKSNSEIVLKLWTALPGITTNSYKLFTQYHISEVLLGKLTSVQIAELTYSNGRRFGTKKANRLLRLSKNDHIRVLSAVPGISKKTAEIIIQTYPLKTLVANWSTLKKNVALLSRGKLAIGVKLTNTIENLLVQP